jgi:hypothetical protein
VQCRQFAIQSRHALIQRFAIGPTDDPPAATSSPELQPPIPRADSNPSRPPVTI